MRERHGLLALLSGVILATLTMAPAGAAPGTASATYSQGMPWEQYLAGTKVQRETWLRNADRKVPPGLVERMRRAGDGLKLLIVTADWCVDSVHSVPYIARLASGAGVGLRVVDFQTGKAIMDTHRTPDGRASTPTVVLLRGDQEVGAWVERPASLQWWYLDMANQVSEEERVERKVSWYDWNRGADALNEIVVLAEQTAKKP
jgi:hypothetical protein